MNEETRKIEILPIMLTFVGLPILLYATGDVPRRTLLKESISILTIMAFCLMPAQFFLTRCNSKMLRANLMSKVIKIHKFMGYILLCVLLVHPFLIVVPRYFEAGIDSSEAFITIITTFSSFGIVLGISAWLLMVCLGVTSFMRKKLPLSYKKWRILHGILSGFFIILASWHAIDLGRHTTSHLSSYIVIAGMGGVLLLLKTYISRSSMKQRVSK